MSFKIHFVTGKGGVGKSAYALSLAQKLAHDGANTLLVELGDSSFYQNYLGLSDVGFAPTVLEKNLGVSLWTGAECLAEYAQHLIKVPALVKLFLQNPLSQALIDVAPGLSELAILGKITSGPRQHGPPFIYDCIVVDAYASGHFLSLIKAPRGMAEAISQGPMGTQSRGIDRVLCSSDLCEYHVVSLPADLPLTEGIELYEEIKKWTGCPPRFVLNKVWPVPLANSEIKNQDDFSRYVQFQIEKKTQAENILQQKGIPYSEVPMIYTHDASQVVKQIESEIRSVNT